MKESLGGSMLFNLVLIFAGVIVLLFIGILSYSKAYKVKNRIVEIIEKYETYEHTDDSVVNDAVDEINPDLHMVGYDSTYATKCDTIRDNLINSKYSYKLSENLNVYGYNYCIFEMCDQKDKNDICISREGKYYIVVSFIEFEFPVINDVLTLPIYGETKMLGKTYDY
jgi:hypothetical protein